MLLLLLMMMMMVMMPMTCAVALANVWKAIDRCSLKTGGAR